MVDFSILFIIGGSVCFILTSIILFFWQKPQPEAYLSKLLSVVLLAIGWSTLCYMFILSGLIRLIPWWYGYGIPVYLLIPPLSYLYVRGTIYRQSRLNKHDYWHFIPGIITLIAMLPFYFSSIDEKSKAVNAIVHNLNNLYYYKTGLIPPIWYFICRPIQSLIYLFFQWRLLVLLIFRPAAVAATKRQNHKKVNSWLLSFVIFQTIINIGVAVSTVIAYCHLSIRMDMLSITKTPMAWESLLFFIFSLVLLFTPNVLYGYPASRYKDEQAVNDLVISPTGIVSNDDEPELETDNLPPDRGAEISAEQLKEYVAQIEAHIQTSEIFRKQGISINELAVELKIPSRMLSQVINQHYNQRFTDYINTYRICYFKNRIALGDSKVLTLESLAMDAGFSSRSTFFAAFKKSNGVSPTEYINALKTRAN